MQSCSWHVQFGKYDNLLMLSKNSLLLVLQSTRYIIWAEPPVESSYTHLINLSRCRYSIGKIRRHHNCYDNEVHYLITAPSHDCFKCIPNCYSLTTTFKDSCQSWTITEGREKKTFLFFIIMWEGQEEVDSKNFLGCFCGWCLTGFGHFAAFTYSIRDLWKIADLHASMVNNESPVQ